MTWNGRFALSMIAAAALLLTAPPRAAAQETLDGMYASRGVNPDGTEYRGVVRIIRQGDRFVVSWMAPRAIAGEKLLLDLTSIGVGILSNGTLAVSYYTPGMLGIVVYRIEADGRLDGQWTLVGDDGAVRSETLTKLPPGVVAPAEGEPPPSQAPSQRDQPDEAPARPADDRIKL
jgi:hypothetical protein